MAQNIIRKLQCTGKHQYILTIPKTIIQLLEWHEQDIISFGFEKGKLILIPPVALNSHIPFLHPRKLQVTPKGQYTLTLPKNIIQLLQWQTHDIIIFGFDHGKINLSKGVDHA